MKIAINCLRVDPGYYGGLNTYTLGVLDGLAQSDTHNVYEIYHTSRSRSLFERYRSQPNFVLQSVDEYSIKVRKYLCRIALLSQSCEFYRRASDAIFEVIQQQMDEEADLVYTPTVVLQAFNSKKPSVLSMHDIQHVHFPEFLTWSRRLSRRITYGLSARYASFFQASSDFIKQDMLSHFPNISPDQIEVIPEGVNLKAFTPCLDTSDVTLRYRLPERFLFCPAQLWPHKNHLTILKALRQLETQMNLRIPLVMTGANYSAGPVIFRFLSDNDMKYVAYLGKLPFQDMVAIYQRAAYLVSPGLYESNSLPVLEAAASGTAIIASRIPPNEELSSSLRLNLFDPLNVDQLAELIRSLWEDDGNSAGQVEYNLQHVEQYSWVNTAKRYVCLFEKVLSH
jgi:glycosyltransferase involved in cell wall biosynthesis